MLKNHLALDELLDSRLDDNEEAKEKMKELIKRMNGFNENVTKAKQLVDSYNTNKELMKDLEEKLNDLFVDLDKSSSKIHNKKKYYQDCSSSEDQNKKINERLIKI